jgi:hypothetical protein
MANILAIEKLFRYAEKSPEKKAEAAALIKKYRTVEPLAAVGLFRQQFSNPNDCIENRNNHIAAEVESQSFLR